MKTTLLKSFSALILASVAFALSGYGCTRKEETPPPCPTASQQSKELAAAQKAEPKYPIEQFLKIVTPRRGGRTDAGAFTYMSHKSGVEQLYMNDGKAEKQLTKFPDGLSGYLISPDRKRALLTAAPQGNEQYDIYLLDFETTEIKPLLVNPEIRYEDMVWAPDSESFLYSANHPSPKDFYIYRFDIKSGESSLELAAEGSNSPLAFSPDGKSFTYGRNRSITDSDGYLKKLGEKGMGKPIFKSKGETFFMPFAFAADGRILAVTNKDEEFNYPAFVDPKNFKITPIEKRNWPLEDAIISASRKTLVYSFNEDGASKLTILNDKFEKLPAPELPLGVVSLNDISDEFIIFSLDSGARPTTVYVWEFADKKLSPIAEPDLSGLDPKLFREPTIARVKSFDGLEIPVYVYTPEGEGARPFIVYPHGGPEAQFRPYFSRFFQYMLMHGFGIAAPNVRGSTGYGRAFSEADNYKKRMDSVKDFKAVADWLIAEKLADPQKLSAMGGSYGGFMVMASITEYPELFKAAVNSVGIVNFVNFLKNTSDYRRKLREVEYGPLSDEEFLKSISPIHKIDKIQTPLFIVHGKNDPRVPVSEAIQIHEELTKMGKKSEILIFEDEGHGIRKLSNRLIYYPKMLDFLRRALGIEALE